TEAGRFRLLQEIVMPVSTPDDHMMEGRKILLHLGNGCDQVFVTFDIGEPPDGSDNQRIRWTAEPIRLMFSLSPRPPESLTIDPARHHGEPIGLADSAIKVSLPFRIRQGDQSIRDHSQRPFDLEKQPRLELTEVAVEHMAVRGMDDDRHPGNPGSYSPQHTGLRCMGMDQCRPLVQEQANQLPQSLRILDRVDLSRQRRKQHPANCGLLKFPAIFLGRQLPALGIPTARMPSNHYRLELRTVMAESGQHRVLRRPAMVKSRNHMDHLPWLRSLGDNAVRRNRRATVGQVPDNLMRGYRSVLQQVHEQMIQISRMRQPVVALFDDLTAFL